MKQLIFILLTYVIAITATAQTMNVKMGDVTYLFYAEQMGEMMFGSGNNLVTYSFEKACSSSLALFTATGMVKGTTYYVKSSKAEPTDATTAWHGLYLGSSHTGTSSVTSFTAK